MMLVIHIYGYHSVTVLLVQLYSKNILMQGLQINTFSHGMHTLTTHPKLQIINYSNIYHNFGENILVSFNSV